MDREVLWTILLVSALRSHGRDRASHLAWRGSHPTCHTLGAASRLILCYMCTIGFEPDLYTAIQRVDGHHSNEQYKAIVQQYSWGSSQWV